MFYSTTDLNQFTFKYSDKTFANLESIYLGDFFSDCLSQNLSSVGLIGVNSTKYFSDYLGNTLFFLSFRFCWF